MGRINGSVTQKADAYEYWIDWNESNVDVSNNTSVVSATVYIKCNAHTSYENNKTSTLTINGQTFRNTLNLNLSPGTTVALVSGSVTVGHNNDGSQTVTISASSALPNGSGWGPKSGSASALVSLTTIPRYANLTNLSVESKTINTITLKYTTDRPAWLFVNLNNGEDWLNNGEPFVSNTTSGTFTIKFKDRASTKYLDPNTNYNITILCRSISRDSGLNTSKNISVSTYDIAKITSAPNINIGSAHTIIWSNPSGVTTNLKLCKIDNSTIIDYGTVTGTSKAITPTASTIYALTTNNNTYTARYIITTTANGKSYTNSKDFTFTVTNSNPTFSNFTYQDTNTTITALTGNNQILVNGYSNVKAIISTANKAMAKNSATMKSYKLLIGTKNTTANYNASSDVNMNINQIDNNVIDMYAIDSRGNSTKVSKTATIKNYSNIKITSLIATRQNNVGTITTLKFEGEFWNASFGSVTNKITSCKYKYKTTSNSTWIDGKTALTYTISGNKITGNLNIQGDAGTDGFSVSNSFDIQLILADKLSSTTYNIILTSGNPALAIYKNSIAIGQQYDTNEGSKLQVNGDVKANNFKGLATKATSDSEGNNIIERYSKAMTVDGGNSNIFNNVSTNKELFRSGLYTINTGNVWYNLINVRHRNGIGDGVRYGIQLAKVLTDKNSALYLRSQAADTWNNWEIIDRYKVLYDNSSGTTGTLTLSETAANFRYLEIFYGKNNGRTNAIVYSSTRIFSANDKKVSLVWGAVETTNANQFICATYTISGTSLLKSYEGYVNVNTSAGHNVSVSNNELKVFRVVGHR